MVGAHCANEDVVEKFEELMRIHETRKGPGDMFRVILYRQGPRPLPSLEGF